MEEAREFYPEGASREQFIAEQFERANLDIRAYPDLFDRFRRLHSPESKHFEDAAQMAEIIDAIWPELEAELPFKLDKEKLLQTTLLHDVGKSGPEEATPEEQELVVALFNPDHYRKIAESGARVDQMTVIDAFRGSDFDLAVQLQMANALKKWGIDFETEKMIDLWRRHADWTFDILSPIKDQKITRELATAAASHHILDGKNPAGLNSEEIPDEAKTLEIVESYEVITMVDKFQAFVKRSGLGHKEAITVLRGMIDRQSFPEKVKDDYRKILTIIDRSGEKLQAVLKLRS